MLTPTHPRTMAKFWALGLAILWLGLVPRLGVADETPADSAQLSVLPTLPAEIHESLQNRDFAKAIEHIDAALKKPKAPADYLLYLKARASISLAKYEDAVETFLALEKDHPKSRWLSRSRFGRAEVFQRTRNYAKAGEIYQAEAKRLLSENRRDELTGISLEFAKRYFEGIPVAGPTSEKKPNYQLALTFYQEGLRLKPSPKLRREIEFHMARCHQELGQHDQAVQAYEKFLANYASENTSANEKASDELEIAVRYQLGKTQLAKGHHTDARLTWNDFLRSPLAKKATPDRIAEITYELAYTHGVPSPGSETAMQRGVEALERFLKQFPEHKLAAKASLEIAQSFLHFGRYDRAIERLKMLIEQGREDDEEFVAQARQLLGQSYFAQQKYTESIAAWRDFLDEHPSHPKWSEVQRQVITAEFQRGELARQNKNYEEARKQWSTFLNKYPLDERASLILLRFGQMQLAEGIACQKDDLETPPDVECIKHYEAAIADWKRLAQKYPQNAHASQALFLIGVTLEDHLNRLSDALEAYKKVQGQYQSNAQTRIANLTAKQLEVITEQKFHTDEKPEILVHTRNLEELSIKIYRIDMADYFRKMHLATGIETLDIALIDPDKAWEFKVEDYEKYRRFTSRIPIPTDGPGVTAVTVSSEKQEATTMLIVSDLDIIVKTSRNELFLFAENLRTQKPLAGASVLISDGEKVFAEETTGENGVLQKSFDQLKTTSDLRVFAIFEGHAASTVTALSGLEFAVGLSPKGYLYTDRPAYRAGEVAHVKGVVRWVSGDQFTFKPGEKYTLDIHDARGRVIETTEVTLGEFGTFSHHVLLPDTSPQGQSRVHLYQPGKSQSYATTFTVHESQLEPVEIAIDLDENIVYRGEKIAGKITLQYYYGTPLSERTIRYQLAGGRWYSHKTDDKGQVEFEFETEQFSESANLTLLVEYPERNLRTTTPVHLVTEGLAIALKTTRKVFISGESFDVTATLTDPGGEPIGTDVTLEIFERTQNNNQAGERLVATHPLKSDPKTGEVRHTLTLDKAGIYFLRAHAKDRFENRITGATGVEISGDEDQIRLRLLVEKQFYKVGDEVKFTLHWREKPALALLTYEGAKILGYRVVTLKTGANVITLPMDAKLAPNFRLCANVMHDHRFHASHTEFLVERELQIAMNPNQTTLEPGGELQVDLVVTDPQGRPISAELSLALIQKNLLDVFPENRLPISRIYTGIRKPAMRVQSSVSFEYRPHARDINRFLLAEEERKAILTRELAALKGLSDADGEFDAGGMAGGGLLFENNGNTVILGDGGELDGLNNWRELPNQSGEWFAIPADQFDQTLSLLIQQQQQLEQKDAPMNGPAMVPGQAAGNGSRRSGLQRFRLEATPEQTENFSFYVQLGRGVGSNKARLPRRYIDELSRLDGTIVGLNHRGEMQVVNGLSPAQLDRLTQDGLDMLPGMGTAETGYWNPIIVTDKQGKARVSFRLPERSTAWKLTCRGVTKDTLAGQTEQDIVTKKDLFGQLKAPLAFMRGDKAEIIAEVHNAVIAKGDPIQVIFQAKLGEKTTELRKALVSNGPGIQEVLFPITLEQTGELEVSLSVESGKHKDRTSTTVAITPFGVPVFATAAGTSAQNTVALVGFPKDAAPQNPQLEILVGPTVNRALVDAVLGSEPIFPSASAALPSHQFERAVSDVLGGTAVLAMLRKTQAGESPAARELSARVQSGIASLVSSQRNDGGWSWSGKPAASSDRFHSSRVVWALADARDAGFAVPEDTWNNAVQHLKSAFAASPPSDREGQAILLHGLSKANAGDFAFANRLYRERNTLSASGLLHVALSLIELDRKSMAEDLLKLVELPIALETANQQQPDAVSLRCLPWMQSNVELRALLLLTQEQLGVNANESAKLADWLMAARQGTRWTPEKVNGPTLVALSQWFSRERQVAEKYRVTVFVNNQQVKVLDIAPETDQTHRISVPADFLKPEGQQQINFDITGRGRFSYSAMMQGFQPADKLKNTTKDWYVRRVYEPAPLLFEGRTVPRGFNVLSGSYEPFQNPLTELPLGERGYVTLSVWRRSQGQSSNDRREYLVVTEPIPAGCMVLQESIQGSFERFELSPGGITFYLGNQIGATTIRYQIAGYLPGEYRTLPTLARSFYRPDRIAISDQKTSKVLGRDQQSSDDYRLSPQELFTLGQWHFNNREYAKADDHLSRLFRNYRLNAKTYQQTIEILFRTSLELNKDQYVVEYFEIIKEKYPEIEIDFANILRVAAAYRELGEYERSFLVYRATVEARFERESQIAGFLKNQNEFLHSIAFLERLLHEYPAESYVATATYALAGEVYGIADAAATNAKLKKAKVTRVNLIAANIHMLDHFLSTWPDDPAADVAAFSMANSYLDLEQFQPAIDRCEDFAKRYPKSDLLDSFWYVIGYSQFALGKHQDALKTCEQVADAKRKDPKTGIEVAAANKWQAIYIMGQIYHSLGQSDKAIEKYEEVDDRFPDADEAINFFTRKEIALPEISTIQPQAAKTVTLKYRNVESAQVKVYRIDLMKFGLMQRNLDRITAINLAGIKPYHEMTLELGDGRDYRDREKPLTLPLKDEGAYLVVCRGGNLYSSGLVLISPFELEIQEDAVSGRVRVTVKNAITDSYVDDVHIKAIGSANEKFISGETDLRGIFIADDIQGTTTVIAKKDDNRYAFYRGEKVLGDAPKPESEKQQAAPQKPGGKATPQGKLLENLRGQNYRNNGEQRMYFDDLINNSIEGVKAKGAY